MRKHTRTPFSNQRKFVPKDRRVDVGQIHPAEHFSVTAQDIAIASSAGGAGASSSLGNPNNPSSGDGSTGNLEDTLPIIVTADIELTTIVDNEPTTDTHLLEVAVTLKNLQDSGLSFQWQRQDSGTTTWNDISGATTAQYTVPSGLTVANDDGDKYRCEVAHAGAITTPIQSNEVTVTISRVISIVTQPTSSIFVTQSTNTTIEASATITSGTLTGIWQRKGPGDLIFTDIAGTENTNAAGVTLQYTTPNFVTADTGTEYRVRYTADKASFNVTSSTAISVSGADFKITPAIGGIEFWNLELNGPLIFDPTNATDYSITSLEPNRSKFSTHLWGQGTCAGQGGYTDADIPLIAGDVMALKMNAGGGAAGVSDSGRYAEAGGGYAGIFDTSVSHANALAIAGGAGGSSFNTAGCGGTQQTVSYGYTYQQPYQSTCYSTSTESRSGGISHSYNNGTQTSNYLNYSGSSNLVFITGHWPPRGYYVFWNPYMPDTNYSLNIYPGSCTAGGGACPGFYVASLQKYIWGFVVYFQRNDNSGSSYVSSWSYSASKTTTTSYPCTQYQTVAGTHTQTATAAVLGGAGGGTSGTDGGDSTQSQISATGGDAGTQSTGGSGGTTSSGGSSNGDSGAALQGGDGGDNAGNQSAAGGGGGGGGYYGGGGGAGGYDGYTNSQTDPGIGPQSGGGGAGGSGFVHSTATGTTSAFAGSSHPNRGNAGDLQQDSRIVIDPTFIEITTQPSSVIVNPGDTATFTAVGQVNGVTSSVSYQWQSKSGATYTDISGATSSNYTTGTLSASNAGDTYRCVITNEFCATKTSNDVVVLISSVGSQTYTITTPGETNIPIPTGASEFTFWIWGAGGGGIGECPASGEGLQAGNFSGGSGAFATGTISNLSSTDTLKVFVGGAAQGSSSGMSGYGAGRGGQRSELLYTRSGNTANWYVGGGGGAGQAGQGGRGGAPNGSAGGGSGSYAGGAASASGGGSAGGGGGNYQAPGSGGTGRSGGGSGGGSGLWQGKRGGGGGSGWFGGGGAGGNSDSNCSGGGGGGGSGAVFVAATIINDVSGTSYSNGSNGQAGGVSAPQSGLSEYVSGHGGSSQNGLAVVSISVPGALTLTGVNTSNVTDASDISTATTIVEPAYLSASGFDYNVTIRLRGNSPGGNGGDGGYVQGTFTVRDGQTYRLHYDTRYAAVFYGTGTSGNNCVMLAAEGGYQGNPRSESGAGGLPRPSEPDGGNAGYPSGASGSNLNTSYGGTGGSTSGYRSGSGGNGGGAGGDLSASSGGNGGFFSAGGGGGGVDGNGGAGGFGYYGGGGGGGGWDQDVNEGGYFGGGGGGGSSYFGGLPSPSSNSNSPAEVVVTNTSYGNERGGPQIQIISVAQA